MKESQKEHDKRQGDIETNIAVILTKVQYIEGEIKNMVTKDQFEPVQKIVYGIVTVVLLAVLGAIVALVLKNGH